MLGKPIAGGVPASVWGMSGDVAARYERLRRPKEPGYSGMGTTLSANPLQFAAMRATLEEVMTEANYAHMERLAARLDAGLAAAIANARLPWHVGARRRARRVHLRAGTAEERQRGGCRACAARSRQRSMWRWSIAAC